MKKFGIFTIIGALIVVLGFVYKSDDITEQSSPENIEISATDVFQQTPIENATSTSIESSLSAPIDTLTLPEVINDYEILVESSPLTDFAVELTISTNIPLPIEVMAGLTIKGQNPKDIYIGVSQRVTITTPTQTVILDGERENLPGGEYLAEVTFYPLWGAKNGSNEAKSINEEIRGVLEIELSGSGESKSQADQRNEAQMWVMENVIVGTPWNESRFVSFLGEFARAESELNLHDAYYFPQADMTIIVRRSNLSVVTWRMGLATR